MNFSSFLHKLIFLDKNNNLSYSFELFFKNLLHKNLRCFGDNCSLFVCWFGKERIFIKCFGLLFNEVIKYKSFIDESSKNIND